MGSVSKKRNWAIFIFSGLVATMFFAVPYFIDLEHFKMENTLFQFFFKDSIKLEVLIAFWGGKIEIVDKIARIVYLAFAVSIAVCILLNIIMAFGGSKSRFLRALQKIFYFIFGFVSLLTFLLCLYYPIQNMIAYKTPILDLIEGGGLFMIVYAIFSLILCILQFGACKNTKV